MEGAHSKKMIQWKALIPSLKQYSVFCLVYTIGVILWGAYVRATGSGAGCGDHWPLCNGEVIPRPERIQTVIEFAHRATSGLNLIFVVGLYVWIRRAFAKTSLLRRSAFFALIAIFLEAALGAGLVILKYVEFDQSVGRTISIALHLVNTLFLVSTLVSVIFYIWNPKVGQSEGRWFPRDRSFLVALGGFVALSMMGAIAALGDTLFPATSILHGMQQDLDPTAHFLIRLRVLHPILAVLWIVLLFLWARRFETIEHMKLRNALLAGVTLQFILGILNWVLMAPNWMQIVHLGLAEVMFVTFWWSGLTHETRESRQPA
jgi:heme a synthase